jgi:hypothetical protein
VSKICSTNAVVASSWTVPPVPTTTSPALMVTRFAAVSSTTSRPFADLTVICSPPLVSVRITALPAGVRSTAVSA